MLCLPLSGMWARSDQSVNVCYRITLILCLYTLEAALPEQKYTCHNTYYKQPDCIDQGDSGYACDCGPGFFWNTEKCVALGMDSRLVFNGSKDKARYNLLIGKAFPGVQSFTLALWLRVYRNRTTSDTVVSYSVGGKYDVIQITTWPSLLLRIHNEQVDTGIRLNRTWVHVAWTWSSDDGSWQLFFDGVLTRKGIAESSKHKPIPQGGELVLGQASRTSNIHEKFDLSRAFIGEMSSFNIWHHVMSPEEVRDIFNDCIFSACGDVVEWADFRSGTRGDVKVRWPSYLFTDNKGFCFTTEESLKTCDNYCSHTIGAQCKAEIAENIFWHRTPADLEVKIPCPGQPTNLDNSSIAYAFRTCRRVTEIRGTWADPVLDACISNPELEIKKNLTALLSDNALNSSRALNIAQELFTQTASVQYKNPIDIAAVIDSVGYLVHFQDNVIMDSSLPTNTSPLRHTRTNQESTDHLTDIETFAKTITGIFDCLFYDRNNQGWLATQPPGNEGDQTTRLVESMLSSLAANLREAVFSGSLSLEQARSSSDQGRFAFQTEIFRLKDVVQIDFSPHGEMSSETESHQQGWLHIPALSFEAINNQTEIDLPEYIGISIASVKAPYILPNHDIGSKSKEDNLNSVIFACIFHMDNMEPIENISLNIRISLPYTNDFNVSNPECVRLLHGNEHSSWNWSREGCHLVNHGPSHAECECDEPGIFAVTTDMYNVNWNKGGKPPDLVALPSYIGCGISASMCLFSFVMLIYLRTSSNTAAIHKNFAVAIILGQLTFIFGIDKYNHTIMCKTFAIIFHYFFLATFSWLMNEAFNLYIVITYAAHSNEEHAASAGQWRYYILGWILPAILVGAFVGTHTDDYYAPDMCWIAWQYIWLFLGPAIGIISVTILVLVFTAKEHHESSYAKSAETNNAVSIHTKAIWTQVILLTICWGFAFITLKMHGIIIKYIFALFNCLQGAFFFVFYFLLNDEVREDFLAREKRRAFEERGYDYSPSQSMESLNYISASDYEVGAENHIQLDEFHDTITVASTSSSNMERRRPRPLPVPSSSEEISDCEVMITTV